MTIRGLIVRLLDYDLNDKVIVWDNDLKTFLGVQGTRANEYGVQICEDLSDRIEY